MELSPRKLMKNGLADGDRRAAADRFTVRILLCALSFCLWVLASLAAALLLSSEYCPAAFLLPGSFRGKKMYLPFCFVGPA